MSKKKKKINSSFDYNKILSFFKNKYSSENINLNDGLKIDFSDSWVQLRKSNTEPIIRVYSEAKNQKKADQIANKFINQIEAVI